MCVCVCVCVCMCAGFIFYYRCALSVLPSCFVPLTAHYFYLSYYFSTLCRYSSSVSLFCYCSLPRFLHTHAQNIHTHALLLLSIWEVPQASNKPPLLMALLRESLYVCHSGHFNMQQNVFNQSSYCLTVITDMKYNT